MKIRNRLAGTLLCVGMLVCSGCQNETAERAEKAGCTKEAKVTQSVGQDSTQNHTIEKVTSPDFTIEGISGFLVEQDGKVSYQLTYTPREDRAGFLYWDMPVPYDSYAVVDTERMYQLFEQFASVDWKNLEKSKTKDMGQKDTGVASSKTRFTLSYVDGAVSKQKDTAQKAFTILVGKENGKGQYYCSFDGEEDTVFLLNHTLVDGAKNQKPYDLILKIPYLLDIDTVKEVEITGLDRKIMMEHKDGCDKINGKQVKEEEYNALYSSLLQPGITGEYIEKSEKTLLSDRKEVLSLHYKRTRKEYEDYQVQIFAYDEKSDGIQVNGKVFFLINKEEVEELVGSLEDLQEKL